MSRTLKTIAALREAGLVSEENRAHLELVAGRYAVALTPALSALIDAADPADPIARQFVPDKRELEIAPEELVDPIGDSAHSPVPGIVHRYADRVLLKLTHTCPVYCRFCFRREMVGPGGDAPLAGAALTAALDYIRAHSKIWEVILTGGDPFFVPARIAREVAAQLDEIAHVQIIRWHTRVPVADPTRVTQEFAHAIGAGKKAVYVAIHANHARELSPAAIAAIGRLRAAGISLLSQTVLLKGVNDSAETLAELMRALATLHVKPYYLHQADMAPGTAHFRVPLARAQGIYEDLRRQVSGIACPRFVIDIPGGYGKIPAGNSHIRRQTDGYDIADDRGAWHRLRDT